MSSDDIEDDSVPQEDVFYEADYDEDTIDYELDTDDLLEQEPLSSEPSKHWETIAPDEAPLPSLDPEFELDPEGDFRAASTTSSEAPWSEDDVEAELDSQDYSEPWPLGLIAAAILALVLLTAGGYGVVQQRAAMKEEIRQLQAELATTASNEEVANSRQAQRALDSRNDTLQTRVDALQLESLSLKTQISDLETQLASKLPIVPTPPAAKPTPTTSKAQPTATNLKATAAPVANSDRAWFVNFGSYSQETTAKRWASKLKVDNGELIVIPSHKGMKRFYRVRVVGLPNRAIAEKIAGQLEKTYSLPKLWVGKQ